MAERTAHDDEDDNHGDIPARTAHGDDDDSHSDIPAVDLRSATRSLPVSRVSQSQPGSNSEEPVEARVAEEVQPASSQSETTDESRESAEELEDSFDPNEVCK